MSEPAGNDRRDWIRNKKPGAGADEFARMAARGREELGSEGEASELLSELDGMLAKRFGPQANETGATAGAEKVAKQQTPAKVSSLRPWYAAAAAILLLLAAGYWWTTQTPAFNPEAVYAEAFSPYANELSGRSMGTPATMDSMNATLSAALLAYDRRDYGTAADSFAVYLRLAPAAAPQLYYGISLLADEQPTAALNALRPLQSDPDYGDPARWYAALAELRTGEIVAARNRLSAIANDATSLFTTKARNLLNTLPNTTK
ncbi:MAG: hypothetical protein AAGF89_10090 [Bacteroidota bacterium]